MSEGLAPGAILASFRIESLLGKGGMGEVYLAEDLRLKRKVALKVLPQEVHADPLRRQRFQREAESAAALRHPNICTIHEIGEADGQTFIAMELCDGETLRDRLARGPLGVDEALEVGIQIADGLDEARRRGVIHRDIKSANLLLGERNRIKILDFGLAKQMLPGDAGFSRVETALELTEIGTVVGTAAYMSPEQALGKLVDHRSDIFSFGVVLYEMLAGALPFSGETAPALYDAILHRDPIPLSQIDARIPDPLARIVGKMLAKDPDERYQSVHEVWVDLRRVRGETVAGSIASRVVSPRPKRAFKAAAAAGGVIALTLLALAVARLLRDGESSLPAAPAPSVTSLVALPARVFGAPEFAYLTDAVPSTLSTQLAKVQGLETKLPPTSIDFERMKGDLALLARSYKVQAFVISTITAEARGFVLNVQLVDAASRRMLWSEEFRGPSDSYLQLARQAADGVRAATHPGAAALALEPLEARSSESELAFRQGRYYSNLYNNRHQLQDFDAALRAFERTLELDPERADAAAEIAMLHVFRIESTDLSSADLADDVERWARRALEIDPRLGKGWTALAAASTYGPGAKPGDLLDMALKAAYFGPEDGMNVLSVAMSLSGSERLMTVAYLEAARTDPLYLHAKRGAANLLARNGRSSEALALVDEVLALEPGMSAGLLSRAFILIRLGRAGEAAEVRAEIAALVTRGELAPFLLIDLDRALAFADRDESRVARVLDSFSRQLAAGDLSFHELSEACDTVIAGLASLDRVGESISYLERCSAAGSLPAYDRLMLSPELSALRADSRFETVAARAKANLESELATLEAARARGELPPFLEAPLASLVRDLAATSASRPALQRG